MEDTHAAPGHRDPERARGLAAPLRQLHRRQVGRAGRRAVLRQHHARSPASRSARSRARTAEDIELALDAAHAAKAAWGKTSPAERAQHPEQDRRPHGAEPRAARHRRDAGQRQADPRDDRRRPAARDRSLPLLRRLHPRRRKARIARSTTTPSPITSTSRSAWSARSSRGTSRS